MGVPGEVEVEVVLVWLLVVIVGVFTNIPIRRSPVRKEGTLSERKFFLTKVTGRVLAWAMLVCGIHLVRAAKKGKRRAPRCKQTPYSM